MSGRGLLIGLCVLTALAGCTAKPARYDGNVIPIAGSVTIGGELFEERQSTVKSLLTFSQDTQLREVGLAANVSDGIRRDGTRLIHTKSYSKIKVIGGTIDPEIESKIQDDVLKRVLETKKHREILRYDYLILHADELGESVRQEIEKQQSEPAAKLAHIDYSGQEFFQNYKFVSITPVPMGQTGLPSVTITARGRTVLLGRDAIVFEVRSHHGPDDDQENGYTVIDQRTGVALKWDLLWRLRLEGGLTATSRMSGEVTALR